VSFAALVGALEALCMAQVRYLIVGGFAVAAHGLRRATVDLDLVVQLDPDNLGRALAALQALGYRPHVPVEPALLTDAAVRRRWAQEKGRVVLSGWHPAYAGSIIDLFIAEPFDFDAEYARALEDELQPGLRVRYPCVDTLIAMKLAAGRPQDLLDVEQLRRLRADDPG
jgi:hypothetical protein